MRKAAVNSCRAVAKDEESSKIALVVSGVTSVTGQIVPITVSAGTVTPVDDVLHT